MKILLLFPLIIICLSCSNPENKAKSLIEQKLKESLHDWKSYEPVKFGTIDTAYTKLEDNPIYVDYYSNLVLYNKKAEASIDELKLYDGLYSSWADSKRRTLISESQKYIDSIDKYHPLCKNMIDSFKPEFSGWKMQHSYRANNAVGNKVIAHYMYYFDKNITEIVNSEDVSESHKKIE